MLSSFLEPIINESLFFSTPAAPLWRANKLPTVGDTAPNFRLPASNGTYVALEDFLGKKNVIVYFYPKDFTRGCTAEACSFRDSYEEYTDLGSEVIGISSDSQNSHRDLIKKITLPFIWFVTL